MPKSDRAKAAEAGSFALLDTEGRWRNWGTLTIARAVVKGIEAAGFKIVRSDQFDGDAGL